MNTDPPVAQRRVSVPRLRVRGGDRPRLAGPRQAGPPGRTEILLALAAFAVLCIAALAAAPQLVEPDDYAYRASIVALTDGHPLTLSTAQVSALAAQLNHAAGPGGAVSAGPGPLGSVE